MAARCPASRTLLAVVYATVLYATCTARLAAGKAGTSCPTAKKFLTCVTPQWTMPNMANVILNSNTPALTVLDFPGNVDLRAILPWNDGVTLTYRRTNHSIYQCQVPIFPGYQLMSYASKPASRYHSMFITCPRSPMWTGRQNYYVTGAFRNVSSLSKRAIKGLPQLQAWKTFYMPVARHLSMCLTINPCLMNVFLGISNLQKWVNVQAQGASVEILLQEYFYSFGVNTLPPAWRTATTSFWLMDPSAFNFTGWWYPVEQLTISTGRTYVKGRLNSMGSNTVTMPCATLDLGGQSTAWVLWRDDSRVAVSYQLAAAPNIRLWDKIDLTLWSAGGAKFKNVQLLTRRPSCQFWLNGPVENVPLWRIIGQIPALGSIMERVYRDPGSSTTDKNRVASIDVYLAGTNGVSVRLGMQAGTYRLTSAAQLRTGQKVIKSPHVLIFTAAFDADTFNSGVTLEQGTTTTPIHFCSTVDDCPQEYEYCDEIEGVCLPLEDFTTTAAAAASVSAAAIVANVQPAKGSLLLGELCSSREQCSSGLHCFNGHCAEGA